MRRTMDAHSGDNSFAIDSDRDRTPSGSNHRHQIQKLDVEEIREMLHNATKALVTRARHNSEPTGKLTAALDITKRHPWEDQIERDENGNNIEPWLLGYKNDNSEKTQYYFQWASIQIVGLDVPVILDAKPVRRGESREDIVRDLLENALDILPNIDKLAMDRGFDSHGVKTACEEQGVTYLNPGHKTTSVRGTCANLKQAGQKSTVREQSRLPDSDLLTRKEVYLPAENEERFPPTDPDEDGDDGGDEPEPTPEPSIRQELVEDFSELTGNDEEEDREMFDDFLDEIHEEEEQWEVRGSDADVDSFAVFETNDPHLDVGGYDSPEERLAHIERAVAPYSARWRIENGYKKVKKFLTRTKSKNHVYRFFNFAFGAVLYNCWRLVDLLVKMALEDDPDLEPRVDADQFLTVAKQYYGLDPPD